MKLRFGLLAAMVAMASALALAVGPTYTRHDVAQGFDPTKLPEIEERLLSGFASLELGIPNSNTNEGGQPSSYNPRGNDQCPNNIASNIKVNQNCLNISNPSLAGRGQAQNETSIAINKQNTNQLVGSQNDYRRGDGNCYAGYSTDSGRTWNDSTIPMSFSTGGGNNFPNGSREYWQAGGDTSVAWDTKGNAYLSCQVFNRGVGASNSPDLSSAFLIFRSSNHGASWNFPGRYVRASGDVTGSGNTAFLDKQLMTVDDHVGSPFQDRVYVTWTEFATDGSAFIYEAYSSDYGETFSPPHLVSADSPLCVNTYGAGVGAVTGESSNCNENQFSQPFTGSDGALYVTWNNYNNAETLHGTDNRNQILIAKSVDGGNTFTPPIKVGDYYDLPDCATYQNGQDAGRACVPEKNATSNSIFRATNYASGEVDPTNPAHVVVTYGSYINRHSNETNGCVPTGINPATGQDLYTGVKVAGACNNDIIVSSSADGGVTFTGTATDPRVMPVATTEPGQATSDQFWQWISFTKNGKLATSYYDRQYATDEATGFSDVSLSGSGNGAAWVVQRVTSSPMPPPTEFSGTFYGDYTGLDAWENANPLWMDTRNPEVFSGGACGSSAPVYANCTGTYSDTGLVANDQDIYTANLPVPSK
ncbi:MAG: sialidase family protein [Gaiellaceae bacterium]